MRFAFIFFILSFLFWASYAQEVPDIEKLPEEKPVQELERIREEQPVRPVNEILQDSKIKPLQKPLTEEAETEATPEPTATPVSGWNKKIAPKE